MTDMQRTQMFPMDAYAVVRVAPVPQRECVKLLQSCSPEGWEWRISHNAATEMAQLIGRSPLALRLLVPALKNKVKPAGEARPPARFFAPWGHVPPASPASATSLARCPEQS